MSDVSLVHLVRRQNGPEALAQFLAAHAAHPCGGDYELVLACKGFDDAEDLLRWKQRWADIEPRPRLLRMPDRGFDIGTYRSVATVLKSEFVCFTNSWSRPLVDGWLALMLRAIRQPGVGIVGATGSLEAVKLPRWPDFPNAHIRSNAFMMRRNLFLELDIPEPRQKFDANELEAGTNSITRQVVDKLGLSAVIACADGRIVDVANAQSAGTFRVGEQEQLLVADNRTDDYANAPRERREHLQRIAWGATA